MSPEQATVYQIKGIISELSPGRQAKVMELVNTIRRLMVEASDVERTLAIGLINAELQIAASRKNP
jgi:flagellar basal body rod protein FlgF